MTGLTLFNFDGHKVRVTLADDGTPLFVLADVCAALDIANPWNVAKRLHADDLRSVEVIDSMGRTQRAHAVTEAGVIDVTLDSRKPEARRFRRWLTHDVVPSIMRTGSYGAPALPQDYATALRALAAEVEQRAELEAKVAADAPKVLFADAVATSDTDILVGDLAKILRGNGLEDFGANRLFQRLRDEGYLIRRKGTDWNMPTQKAMDLGLFRIKETAIARSDGSVSVSKTPKVTGKGQTYFIKRYLGTEPLNLQVAA